MLRRLFLSLFLTLTAGYLLAQNVKPQIGGSPRWDVTGGEHICYGYISSDDNPDDTLTFGWDSLPSGMVVSTNNGTVHPAMELCWTPHDSLVSKNPYFVRIWVTDNAKPIPDTTFWTLQIHVNGVPERESYNYVSDSCGILHLSLAVNEWSTYQYMTIMRDDGIHVSGIEGLAGSLVLYPGTFVVITMVRDNVPLVQYYYDTLVIKHGSRVEMEGPDKVCRNQVFEMRMHSLTKGASLSYQWSIMQNGVFQNTGITDSAATFIIAENSIIRCHLTDAFGCERWVEREVLFEDCVGIEETKANWTCYPNPVEGTLFISNPEGLNTSWEFSSVSGAALSSSGTSEAVEQRIDLAGLPPGVYILHLRSDDGRITRLKILHY